MSRLVGMEKGSEHLAGDSVWNRLAFTHTNDTRRERWWRKYDWLKDRANE